MSFRLERVGAAARGGMCAAAFFFLVNTGVAQEFAEGLRAYDGGDYESAAEAWRSAAGQDDNEARLALASLLMDAFVPERKAGEAEGLLRAAAGDGHAVAQFTLAEALEQGRFGGEGDPITAWAWYRVSALNGRDWPERQAERLEAGFTDKELREARNRLAALQARFPALR